MKKNIFNKSLVTLVFAMAVAMTPSCTDQVGDEQFQKLEGPTGSVSKDVTVQAATGHLQEAMARIHDDRVHKYQYQFNLHIDNYSGYMLAPNSLKGRLPRMLTPQADFQTGPRANMLWVAQLVVPVINGAEELKRPELGAIASIIFDFAASEYVDVHGPMPYTSFRNLQKNPPTPYEKVSDVYRMILEDLAKQVDILSKIPALSPEAQNDLNRFDRIAGADLNNWIEFANSLRLRMAMRMVKANPELAQKEFEAAAATNKLLDQDIEYIDTGRHPLYVISNDWNDTRLNANFENLLKRLHHPGLKAWFNPASTSLAINRKEDAIVYEPNMISNIKYKRDEKGKIIESTKTPIIENVNGTEYYMGLRAGMLTFGREDAEFSKSYVFFSGIKGSFANNKIVIIKASETQFLLAEAALRGWNVGGTAKSFYQKGIVASFQKEAFGSPSAYIKQKAEDTPRLDYVDLYDSQYNSPAEKNGSEVLPVLWDDALGKEKLLEMIITQKYIANFPLSLESWSEYRRTGYPVLLEHWKDDTGDGSIPPLGWRPKDGSNVDYSIRRIPFVSSDPSLLPDITATGLPVLKAEDTSRFSGYDVQAAHIWWDVANKGNFQ